MKISALTFILALAIGSILSCHSKPEKEKAQMQLEITLDSAVVNSKGQIIDIQYGLSTFDFDHDKNFMYKFNTRNRHGIEVIDLNKMELIDFKPFEVEGPNGTTDRVYTIHYIADGQIMLTNYQAILIFNWKGKLLKKYPISPNKFTGDSIPADFSMENSGLYHHQENLSFNLVNKGFGLVRGFAKLDLEENNRKVYWINDLEKLDDYFLTLTMDGRIMALRTYLYVLFNDGKYFLSSDMINELYYLDIEQDTIIHKSFLSQLSPNINEVYGKKETESREELAKIMTARNQSIRFKNFVYDASTNQYFRFSSMLMSQPDQDENWKIILTVFDEDFNQIYETDNLPLDKVPDTYFFKNGDLYIFKNMDDELGFLILSFD